MRPALRCGDAVRKPYDLLDFAVDALLRPASRCGDAERKAFALSDSVAEAFLKQSGHTYQLYFTAVACNIRRPSGILEGKQVLENEDNRGS